MERNQALQQYTGWLHTVARGMTAGALHDDLVQEGYIAMWRALGSYDPDKGSLDFWLKSHALNRMRTVVSGGTMTTSLERKDTTGFTTAKGNTTRDRISEYVKSNPTATGAQIAKDLGLAQATVSYQRSKMATVVSARTMTDRIVSLNALMSAFDSTNSRSQEWVPEELHYTQNLEGIEVTYHAGEIANALDVLTPAQKKYVVARFWGGRTPAELTALFGYDPSSLWRDAKPKLQSHLAYLRELVTT